jgi:hypothetical protein
MEQPLITYVITIIAKIPPIVTMVTTLTTSINEHLRGIPHLKNVNVKRYA